MGGATSSLSRAGNPGSLFASPREKAALEKIVSELPVPREDPAYAALFNAPVSLTHLSQADVEYLNMEYGTTLAQNNLRSGNFRVLVRYAIHALPLCYRMEKMTPEEIESYAAPSGNALNTNGVVPETKKRSTHETHIHQALNALFLVRNFTMRFVEKQDECSLLAHFNQVTLPDFNAITSPRARGNTGVRVGDPTTSSRPPLVRSTSAMSDDLAFKFLETLMTILIDYKPSSKTYELYVEVLNMLLVLLSPVAYPRDHSKDAGDLSAHNPFLHMLITSSSPGGKKSFWAASLVNTLLQNYMDPIQSPPGARDALSVAISVRNSEEMSLIKISENLEASTIEEAEQFSYLTLEGIGSLASTIFKFPLSFYHYFVATDGHSYPVAERSALIFLVLMQSCRDSGAPSNPFREVLCSVTNSEKTSSDEDVVRVGGQKQEDGIRGTLAELPFSKLFAAAGHKAPYESSHLVLYTLLYTNPMMLDAAITNCDVDNVILPMLETLYHAKSVDPSRIYMLVITLLTYTQDPAFVRDAHSKMMVHKVPWYSERYILDVSLGSLMMVIFTRLIYRNITHFQDSFIHLNAFAALSNLARSAENMHVYAAQSIVSLIEMLAKMEVKFSAKMERENQLHNEELVQKRSAYVEFIRLLLGVVSSCLKPNLLPRNPQLIYSILYRAETFTTLQQHPEFAHQVNNYSVWSTLSRFQTLVESKTTPEETLDVNTVLELITAECVGLLASTASTTSRHGGRGDVRHVDDDASYRYEEETDPEQFFVPYIWKLIFEQTPEFCWKVDKITLFTPGVKATVVTQ